MDNTNFIENIINEELGSGKVNQIVTRFPPEPNGYLHIGHAKSLCINFGIKNKYNGKCNLRFDDTNPSKEEVEYVNSIMDDIKWLGFSWDALFYASDFFENIYNYAIELIEKGLAFVCDLTAEQMREYRGTLSEPGKESPYKSRSVEENLKLFKEMREGKYKDGEKVLRAKIDMSSPNINMRDPILYRILRATHHRTGDKWLIYPMYDFTHPICDALEGITHSICTLEFEDHRPLYEWVIENLNVPCKPRQIEFARLNITNTLMSKRYLKKLVDEKVVSGWADPRMPTLSGIRNRGIPAEVIKDFCNRIGVSKSNSEVEISYLENLTREYLNVFAERMFLVEEPLKVIITNYDSNKTEQLDTESNPNSEDNKTRKISFSNEIYIEREDFSLCPPPKYFRLKKDGYVRLKNGYIIKCVDYKLSKTGEVEEIYAEYVENSRSGNDESGIKVKGVIHFVDAKNCVDLDVVRFSYLLNDAEYNDQDYAERINRDSKKIIKGAKAEKYILECENNQVFQALRKGYYKKAVENDKIEMWEIVNLKDSFKK